MPQAPSNLHQPTPPPKPDSYLVWAILTTFLCCLPLGIVSIVYSVKVDNLYMTGQYAAAQEASENAKKYAIIAAAIYLAFIRISLTIYLLCLSIFAFSLRQNCLTS